MKSMMALAILLVGGALAQSAPNQPNRSRANAADSNPTFEVATIKPSTPDEQLSIVVRGHRLYTTASSLETLLSFAYSLNAKQIIGGPAWVATEKYDLVAEVNADGRTGSDDMKTMLQKLIADRFKLSFHKEKKELLVYAITVGKSGPKLAKALGDPNGSAGVGFNGPGAMTVKNSTIGEFAGLMQRYVLDRPVVDQTGVSGKYDLTLNWTPDESQVGGKVPASTDGPNASPGLYTAVQEQLGLKLESTKAPVEVLIVDHVEKPSQN